MKEQEAEAKALRKAQEKVRSDELVAPTVKKRDDDLLTLENQYKQNKKEIKESNEDAIRSLKSTSINTKILKLQRDEANEALVKLKENVKRQIDKEDKTYKDKKTAIRNEAKIRAALILKSAGAYFAEDEQDGHEQEELHMVEEDFFDDI